MFQGMGLGERVRIFHPTRESEPPLSSVKLFSF